MLKKFLNIGFLASVCLFLTGADKFPNNYTETFTSCGEGYLKEIPEALPKAISVIYTVIQVAVPVVLVIFGTLDLFKSISAQKEEEMKKGRQLLVKRLIYAAIIFFVFMVIRVLVSIAADKDGSKIIQCADCFIRNECDK